MTEIGKIIRQLRENAGYPLRKVAAYLDIDQAVLSKIERGQRKISKEQVEKLADYFNYDKKKLLVAYLSDQIVYEIGNENLADEALKAAELKIKYSKFQSADRKEIIKKIVKVIKRFSKIKKAWIYGSFARGDDDALSDIDLAIKTDDDFSYFDLAEIQHKLKSEIEKEIDIGFVDSFKSYVFENVKPELRLIYERR